MFSTMYSSQSEAKENETNRQGEAESKVLIMFETLVPVLLGAHLHPCFSYSLIIQHSLDFLRQYFPFVD